jgi:hypothetical protein
MSDMHVGPPQDNHGHEQTDANATSLTKFGIGLAIMILVSMGAMFGLLKYFGHRAAEEAPPVSPLAVHGQLPPEPRLQANPTLDMETYGHWEDSVLTTYGWVDRGQGLVRIPVDSAIVLVARKGLPVDGSLDPRNKREAEGVAE